MDWRHTEILKLICSYRQYECLWNSNSPDYKQQEMRRTSWIALGKEFNKNVDDVKKKIKHLRTCYIVEKKKVNSRRNSNGESTYEPHLYYFNQMTFLDTIVTSKNLNDSSADPLSESKHKAVMREAIVAPKRQRLDSIEISQEEPELEARASPKSRLDSTDSSSKASPQFDSKPIVRRSLINDVPKDQPRRVVARQPMLSKEDTFCAMLCSELMLLRSEDTYDNVTSEIFTAVKNAKIAERQTEYQQEDDSRHYNRRL